MSQPCASPLSVYSTTAVLSAPDLAGELPDELLCGILQLSWSLDVRKRTPAEEVRCALQLRSVCQRMGQLLRTHPLPLRLDFSQPLGSSIQLEQKHVRWLAAAAQQDGVAALTLPGWYLSREERGAEVVCERVSRSLTAELLEALAGNQRRSLRELHGVPAACVGRGHTQVDLNTYALTHLGLVLEPGCQDVCAAALPVSLESLACSQAEEFWGESARIM